MKKYICLFFIFTALGLLAQNNIASENSEADNENSVLKNIGENGGADEFSTIKEFPVVISKFNVQAKYYGLPLSVRMGMFYRKNDISVFPNFGFSFFLDGGVVLNTSAGFIFQKNFFTWDVNSVYDILPFTMNKAASEQIFYGTNNLIFNISAVKISFPFRAGKRLMTALKGNLYSGQTEEIKTVVQLSQGIKLDFFISDIGYFKSTGSVSFFTDWIPKDNFFNYSVYFELPATFHLYYVDLAFMYSFFNSGKINFANIKTAKEYEIKKNQAVLTGRSSFKKLKKYSSIHLFGSELRWYAARTGVNTSGFFLSLFADIGFGTTSINKKSLIAEYGAGAGWTLFDNVPFTFQAGLNQDTQPVFFLGVVSRIASRP